ncbi:MAG: PKD domain-containing protein [Bacteroidia bacterium]|nr:PKD domain-containing protein [Bacteroidia bacterium]
MKQLYCVLLFMMGLVGHAQPPNDNCSNAIDIPIPNGGFGYGNFVSSPIRMLGATVQTGEFIPIQQVARDKTVWFKFHLPTTREIRIVLEQSQSPPPMPATWAGWTLYKTNTCLPGTNEVIDPPIINIEGYTHICLKSGDYMIQVSSVVNANDSLQVRLIVNPSSATETLYDYASNPLNFGVISGVGLPNYMNQTYLVGCQSIFSGELMCPDTNFTQSSWHIFTTDNLVDYVRFELGENPWRTNIPGIRYFGYNLYRGNAMQDSIADGIPAGGTNLTRIDSCKTLTQSNSGVYAATWNACQLEPNTTYSIQLFFSRTYFGNINVRMYEVGSNPTASPFPGTIPPAYQIGNLSYGNNNRSDYFSCNGQMALQAPCAPAIPDSANYKLGGYTYDLNQWTTFQLDVPSNIDFSAWSWGSPAVWVRLYQGDAASGCAGLTYYDMFSGTKFIPCLPAGTWSIQLLGTSNPPNAHQYWVSHLGRQVNLTIRRDQVGAEKYGLRNTTQVDSINGLNGLVSGQTYYAKNDYFDCSTTLLPDGDLCRASNDRAIYRLIYINQNGILVSGGGDWWRFRYRLYRGDPRTAPVVNGRLQGLIDQAGCQSTYYPFKVCVVPGWYVLVTFGDITDITYGDRPWVHFDAYPPTIFTNPVAPEVLDTVSLSRLSVSATPTRFYCDDNPLTILGYAPCNGATKQIYREVYIAQPSLLTFTDNTGSYYYGGGVSYRMFSGRLSTNSLTGLWKDCYGGFTTCTPPGWYTIVAYGYGKTFVDPTYPSGLGGSIGDNNTFTLSINPNVQRFRTFATADTSFLHDPQIFWRPNTVQHTAKYPKNDTTFTFPQEYWDCADDLPFPPGIFACNVSHNRISYRVFTLTKTSYVVINNLNPWPYGYQSRLYSGDIRGQAPPFTIAHDCVSDNMKFCSLSPGVYTLVTFAGNGNIGYTHTPTIYVDSTGYSKFDRSSSAYSFGEIPSNSTEYLGNPSDPLGPFGRAPSNDFFFCTTGAPSTDPHNNCPIGSTHSNNPPVQQSLNVYRRSLWYTFTVTGPGTVNVSVYNRTPYKTSQTPFTIYYSPNTVIPPTDSLSPPLQYINTSTSWWCGNSQTVSFYIDPCNPVIQRRYYVMVNCNYYNEANNQIEVGVRFDPAPPSFVLFDHYSHANQINANPTTQSFPPYTNYTLIDSVTLTGYLGNLNCATKDPTDQNSCGNKTIWYKIVVGRTGRLRFNYDRPNGTTNYNTSDIQLYRSIIPGDSTNSGLVRVPETSLSVNNNPNFNPGTYYTWGQGCVSPGVYYLMFTGCNYPTETVLPRIWFIPDKGDLCSDPVALNAATFSSFEDSVRVDCHTIGEAPGEDGSNMGCLSGPTGYKSTWFSIDASTLPGKFNMDIQVMNHTNSPGDEIRYRVATGSCSNLTFDECVSQGAFIILHLKCRTAGFFRIQVISPEYAIGFIGLKTTVYPVSDTQCVPIPPERPRASFLYTASCANLPVFFTNTSSSGPSITYKWLFGDGDSSFVVNPIHYYVSPGNYPVRLIAFNGGVSDTMLRFVSVYPKPQVSFTLNPASPLAGEPITITPLMVDTIPGATYYWNFCAAPGPCTASPQFYVGVTPPPVSYSLPGNKRICVTISNGNCDSTYCLDFTVLMTPVFVGGPYDGHANSNYTANCEPNIYVGGPYDGHATDNVSVNCFANIYVGGPYDGHATDNVSVNCFANIFVGGPYDGHSSILLAGNCLTNIYTGGPYDGHALDVVFANCILPIYAGGPYDGHATDVLYSNCVSNIFAGGPYDGHANDLAFSNCLVTTVYSGGPYDGHATDQVIVCPQDPVIWVGGPYDGHATDVLYSNCVSNIFVGGPYDGHALDVVFANCIQPIYAGGPYDGHALDVVVANCIQPIYAGGPYDGHALDVVVTNCTQPIFVGGPYDGHASVSAASACFANIFVGGPYDGHADVVVTANCTALVYAGGPYDGHSSVLLTGNCLTNIFVGGPYDGHATDKWSNFTAPNGVACYGQTVTFNVASPTNWYDSPVSPIPIASNTNSFTTPPLDQTKIYYIQNTCTGNRSQIIAQVNYRPVPEFTFSKTCLNQPVQFYNITQVSGLTQPTIGGLGFPVSAASTVGVPPPAGRISFSNNWLYYSYLYDGSSSSSAWTMGSHPTGTYWVQWNYLSKKSVNRFYYWAPSGNSPTELRLYFADSMGWKLVKVFKPASGGGNFDTYNIPETNCLFANRWKLEVDAPANSIDWREFQVFASTPTIGGNPTWNFANGDTSTAQNPTTIYTVPGIYNPTLTISLPGNCDSSTSTFLNMGTQAYLHYRSKQVGNWSDTSTWQIGDPILGVWLDMGLYNSGCGSASYPTRYSRTILVRHNVLYNHTIPADTMVDELTINNVGNLKIPLNNTLYLHDTTNAWTSNDLENYGRLEIEGDFTPVGNAILANDSLSTVAYIRAGNQNMWAGKYGRLEIRNGGEKFSTGNSSATTEVQFQSGHITLGNTTFTLGDSAIITGHEYNTGYFVTNGTGSLKKRSIGGTQQTFLFPIGHSTASYNRLQLWNQGTKDNFSARVSGTFEHNGPVPPNQLETTFSVNRTWHVEEEIPGGSLADIKVWWITPHENASFDNTQAFMGHWYSGSGTWMQESTPAQSIGVGNNISPWTYKANGFSSFSPFAVGSDPVILPIRLLSFKGKLHGKDALLTWETADEVNCSGYRLHHAYQVTNQWEMLTWQDAQAQSYNSYQHIHKNLPDGRHFYQLEQVDFDGRVFWSEIVELVVKDGEVLCVLYPNPTNQAVTQLSLTLPEENTIEIAVYNSIGQQVWKVNPTLLERGNHTILLPAGSLAVGTYHVQVRLKDQVINQKLVITR